MGDVLKINKLLTFKQEDIAICRQIESLFVDRPHVCFDWNGHIFTGKLKTFVHDNAGTTVVEGTVIVPNRLKSS